MSAELLVQFLPLLLLAVVIYGLVRVPRWRRAPGWRSANSSPFAQAAHIVGFRNPANGYEEQVGTPWICCLLFGCIYFAVRGIWTHAVAALLLALLTAGVSWLVYPLFARGIVERHYLRKGWLAVPA